MQKPSLALSLALVAGLALPPSLPLHAETGTAQIAERVQIVYDPATGEVARRTVRVVDPHPELGLEFRWEPEAGEAGIDALGFATGPGTLTWRIPGTPAYDPRAFYERYTGGMLAGAYDGKGRLVGRDGTIAEGTWRSGRLEGTGSVHEADGSAYRGNFRDGRFDGNGSLLSRYGWEYRGTFRDGEMQGAGEIVIPGGARRAVVMEAGQEVAVPGDVPLPDDSVDPLRPAQTGSSQAERALLSITANTRPALDQGVIYGPLAQNGTTLVYPLDEEISTVWTGNGQLFTPKVLSALEDGDAWLATRVYFDIDLRSSDGRPLTPTDWALAFDWSEPNLRPMLTTRPSCTPGMEFELLNFGWGSAETPRIELAFGPPIAASQRPSNEALAAALETARAAGGLAEAGAGELSDQLRIRLRSLFASYGVDVDKLDQGDFVCHGSEVTDACVAEFRRQVQLGALAPFVTFDHSDFGYTLVNARLYGRISYTWHDNLGTAHDASEVFTQPITFSRIAPDMMAEYGDGAVFPAGAPNYLELELPAKSGPWRVELPRRGAPSVARLFSQVKMWSRQSSMHSFHVEVRFSDGSVRNSAPVMLYFFQPRFPADGDFSFYCE